MSPISKKIISLSLGLLSFVAIAAKAATTGDLLHKSGDPVAGNPKGSVTVVEFFDYQCSHCMNMAPTISAIISSNPNVRWVFKELPIRGAMSQVASRAALAANMQGKYYSFNHALLTTNQPLTEEFILQTAKENRLNISKLKNDMNSARISAQIKANFALASKLGVEGTPAFFIAKTNAANDAEINFQLGEMSQSQLQTAIDKATK